MDSFSNIGFIFLCVTVKVKTVTSTEIDANAGLKYYIIGGTVLGIFLGIVVISFFVLCWCCRTQKPKEVTEVKSVFPRESTVPKNIISNIAPRRDFMMKNQNDLPYKKTPRLLNREESYV